MTSATAKRYELFAREYVIDHNGTRAAKATGYSEFSAHSQSTRLLKTVKVQRLIARFESERASRIDIRADRVLEELARLAFLDPRNFYNDDGTLKAITELDQDTAACLAGVEFEKLYEHYAKGQSKQIGTTTKIKFHDKGQNLERLGRHLKLFTEKVEISDDSALLTRLLAGRNRLNDPPKEGGATS